MKSITSTYQKLALNIKKSIKDHYQNDGSLLKELNYNRGINDELEEYFYLTYKDYDKLRIIILNILHLIFHDVKDNKRKNKKKIINLMNIYNNTYIYISLPKNIYLYKFQKFVNNILFSYYKGYIYKAQLQYPSIKELPTPVVLILGFNSCEEEYNPMQIKILPALCKKKEVH